MSFSSSCILCSSVGMPGMCLKVVCSFSASVDSNFVLIFRRCFLPSLKVITFGPKVMNTKKNLVLIIASTGVFFEALDIAIVNLAMPLIQHDFNLATDEIQWV